MIRLRASFAVIICAAVWAAGFSVAIAQEAVLPPTGVAASQVGFLPDIRVTWDASPTAGDVLYRVYRSSESGSLGSIIRSAETGLGYVDTATEYGNTYYYRVLTLLGGVPSALSEQVSALPVVPPPLDVSAEDLQKGGAIKITWSVSDSGGGLAFEVYRSTSASSRGSRIASKVSGAQYEDTRARNGTAYYYHVRSLTPDGDASEFMVAGPVSASNSFPDAPNLSVRTTTYNKRKAVFLSWSAPANTSTGYYRVYRSTLSGDIGGFRIETTARNFTDTDAREGNTYHYRVRAYRSDGALLSESDPVSLVFGSASSAVLARIENFSAQASGRSGEIKLSWSISAPEDVSYIRIYRNTAAAQGSLVADRVRGSSYTDRNLRNGTTYYYTAAPVNAKGDEQPAVALVHAVPFAESSGAPPAVARLRAIDQGNGASIALSWANPPLHEYASLSVYRSTDPDERGEPLRTGFRGNTHTDMQSVQAGVRYYYTVVAINKEGIAAQNSPRTVGVATVRLSDEGFDTDGDGMPDSWERSNGFHPHLKDAPESDNDQDGLGVLEEYQNGTDPWNSDTDGDGHTDGTEVFSGYNPLGQGRKTAETAPIAETSPAPAFAYRSARLSSLSEEQRLAAQLRASLESEFGAGRIPNPRSHWPKLVNAYIYGGYTASEIAHTLRLGPGLVHPEIVAAEWRQTGEYRRKRS